MEIMLVVVLFAIVATGVSMGLGALYRTKLRSGAVDIASAARFAYHRAVTRSRTVRIVLDLDQHTVSVEEAHGQITLDMSEERAEDTDEDNAAVDPWAAAAERLGSAQQAHVGRAGFSVIAEDDGEPIERYGPHRLPVADSALIAEATGGNADIRGRLWRGRRHGRDRGMDARRGSQLFRPQRRPKHPAPGLGPGP